MWELEGKARSSASAVSALKHTAIYIALCYLGLKMEGTGISRVINCEDKSYLT